MNPELDTVFVLGAGFSFEQGYPLARDMRQHVMSLVHSERFPWRGYLEPGSGGYPEGHFFAGLQMIEGSEEMPFEELLITLASRLKEEDAGPCHQTNEALRMGTRYVLWEIHNSIENIQPAYRNFASRLRSDWHRHGIISFNWDLQAELALNNENIPWHYSLIAQGRLPVIKPHGSINWNQYRQKDLSSDYPYWCSVGSTNLSFDSRYPLSDPRLDDVVADLNYTLFPGDPDLPASSDNLELLWRDAACLIDRAEEVVFVGYSFPEYDCHSREFFGSRVRDKKVVVVNPSGSDLEKLKCVLGAAAAELELFKQEFRNCQYAQPAPGT